MARLIADKLSHAKCKEIMGKKQTLRLGHNTRLERCGDTYFVIYHATAILTFRPDGSCELNSGGWRTATTKQRLNTLGPVSVWQHKHEWFTDAGPFEDGMIVMENKRC